MLRPARAASRQDGLGPCRQVGLGYGSMLSVKAVLFVTLGLFAAIFVVGGGASVWRRPDGEAVPDAEGGEGERLALAPFLNVIGFVVNFFDTLGIGSFSNTTSLFQLRALAPERGQ